MAALGRKLCSFFLKLIFEVPDPGQQILSFLIQLRYYDRVNLIPFGLVFAQKINYHWPVKLGLLLLFWRFQEGLLVLAQQLLQGVDLWL